MGLMAKIPNIVPMISNVGNFVTNIGKSLGLFNTSSTDNSTSNIAQNKSKYNLTEETSGKNSYYHPDDGVMRTIYALLQVQTVSIRKSSSKTVSRYQYIS